MTDQPRTKRVQFKGRGNNTLVGIYTNSAITSDKAVILCHGHASTKDSFQLPGLTAALSASGFNSLRFDFSGNGESTGVFRLANYLDEVEEIFQGKAYLESAEKQRVVGLVGHSKGGNDVLLYASIYDDIPLVINIAGRLYMDRGIKERFGDGLLDEIKSNGSKDMKSRRSDGTEISWQLTSEDLERRLSLDMKAAVASIKRSKILTIHGSADTVIPVGDGKDIAELIPGSDLVVVEGADHNFRGEPEHAEQLIKTVVDFMVKHAGA